MTNILLMAMMATNWYALPGPTNGVCASNSLPLIKCVQHGTNAIVDVGRYEYIYACPKCEDEEKRTAAKAGSEGARAGESSRKTTDKEAE